MEATILHHICIVLFVLWLFSACGFTHPVLYSISLIYLYVVHEQYVIRLRRNIRFEERRYSFQRRVLSDSETVRWLNYALEKIWPVCMEKIVSQKLLLPIIPWFLEKYKPWTAKEAVIQHLYLGRSPPVLTEMRVVQQSTGDDHLVMELGMNFRTAEDMSVILVAKLRKRLGFGMWAKLHLTGLHLEGKVLVGVKFLGYWPFLGRLRVCFVEPPYFQMTVKPLFQHGLDVTELPGISGWVDNLLAVAFEQTLVEPNMLVVDMEKFVSPDPEDPWFSINEKEPIAYAMVEVIEAADIGFSDPYVKGQLGPYKFRTKTQKKTLSPKWNEEFKVPICTWESPNELAIEVGDKDLFLDDILGNCCISITNLRDGQRHDMWLSLKNVKVGRLHLAITVVEGNKEVHVEKCDREMLTADNDKIPIEDETSERDSISSEPCQNMPNLTDKFEPISLEGQQKNGVWVHYPGSTEVTQIREPKKGKSRVLTSKLLVEGSPKSSISGNNNVCSSSDESQEGNKGNRTNKVAKGLKRIGSLLYKSSKKSDANSESGDSNSSPNANMKTLDEKDNSVKLFVDDPDIAFPSHLSVSTSGVKDGTDREKHSGQSATVKGKAKSIVKQAGQSANKLKNTFTPKGSKKPEFDLDSSEMDKNLDEGSESFHKESVPSSIPTTRVESFQLASKPISTGSGLSQSKLNDQMAKTQLTVNG